MSGRRTALRGLLAAALLGLAACASVIDKSEPPTLYDLGPLPPPAAGAAPQAGAALVLPSIEASGGLDSTALLYRLGYENLHELRPYAQARWSAPVPQLVHERLGALLARERAVIGTGELTATPRSDAGAPRVLRLQLQEFAHHFEAPQRSRGTLRLRATLLQSGPLGDRLIAQRSFEVQQPAPSPDAAGGVRALSQAVDAAARQIDAWLRETRDATPAA
ncbi:ABC-type transport auxiliary lipoprotein family protein [Ramlibacter rhizophilus]|uniref:ABC-type transport auxiliary lipoprotein component domain-containing protein n=1 Tax=Ramlibacter rhizophilus TaxID=1781167 RepID=A0A4Z0BIP4_9BURK|nr:ABC-type transport auxiliary lipoprotein family protein [Ramlibacter rhizophilus]TFY97778.1 hypothetical protein EZ242_15015 [Ramlibacter rhizophilus]